MADDTKIDESVKTEEVAATPPVVEPTVETAPAPAPQEGQIDHKFFKRVQWGLTAATVFCGAAGFTAAHFEDKKREQQAPPPAVAPVITEKPVTPLVRAPS